MSKRNSVGLLAGNTMIVVLLLALCAVCVALVYTRHESRRLFVEMQALSKQRDALQIEWRQLQLEESAFSSHGLIEDKARGALSLQRPNAGDVFFITDDGDYRFVNLTPSDAVLQATESSQVVTAVAP